MRVYLLVSRCSVHECQDILEVRNRDGENRTPLLLHDVDDAPTAEHGHRHESES